MKAILFLTISGSKCVCVMNIGCLHTNYYTIQMLSLKQQMGSHESMVCHEYLVVFILTLKIITQFKLCLLLTRRGQHDTYTNYYTQYTSGTCPLCLQFSVVAMVVGMADQGNHMEDTPPVGNQAVGVGGNLGIQLGEVPQDSIPGVVVACCTPLEGEGAGCTPLEGEAAGCTHKVGTLGEEGHIQGMSQGEGHLHSMAAAEGEAPARGEAPVRVEEGWTPGAGGVDCWSGPWVEGGVLVALVAHLRGRRVKGCIGRVGHVTMVLGYTSRG